VWKLFGSFGNFLNDYKLKLNYSKYKIQKTVKLLFEKILQIRLSSSTSAHTQPSSRQKHFEIVDGRH
jgi:hypothetical protein